MINENTELENTKLPEELVCPECGKPHRSPENSGWWAYATGKWCCDCGAEGLAWYTGEDVSTLA